MKKFLCQILSLLIIGCSSLTFISCGSSSTEAGKNDSTQNNIIEPINISLSVNNLELTKGETYQLYATISPSTADQTVIYSSANESCATVTSQGLITALNQGNTVIRAETVNGLIATCNIEVSIAVGEVSGCMMYQNGATSSSPTYADQGATLQLIPTNIKSFPKDYTPVSSNNYEEYGIYTTTTDLSGNYKFSNIPIGEYRLIIISEKADWHSKAVLEHLEDFDGYIEKIFGEYIGSYVKKSEKKASFKVWFSSDYATYSIITVKENSITTKSLTYTNWSAIL
ncbi:MAG: Ig-like domain-containing protein [Clostridia bacterium]|nr:Ig-like domain-containing protein [Clostridia bacterium]MBR6687337.1 Ig-like domain-containing protein [Clostridia bacterium]